MSWFAHLTIGLAPAVALVASADGRALTIVNVNPSAYAGPSGAAEKLSCERWRLTPRQVERFFRLSKEYPASPYRAFYQLNCSVTGELQSGGRKWSFSIDGGGTATWRNAKTTGYWGCSAPECEPLVILLSDGMRGDK